jgi:hypothetical protein
LSARDRWKLAEDPHFQHYRAMIVLVTGHAATILDLEAELVGHYQGAAGERLIVNLGPGGRGLGRHHPHACLYLCVEGDVTRWALTQAGGGGPRGIRRPGFCVNVACRGRCSSCVK